jgi:hypothetical protein
MIITGLYPGTFSVPSTVPLNTQVFGAISVQVAATPEVEPTTKLPVKTTPFVYVKVIVPPAPNVAPVRILLLGFIEPVVKLNDPMLAGGVTELLGIYGVRPEMPSSVDPERLRVPLVVSVDVSMPSLLVNNTCAAEVAQTANAARNARAKLLMSFIYSPPEISMLAGR